MTRLAIGDCGLGIACRGLQKWAGRSAIIPNPKSQIRNRPRRGLSLVEVVVSTVIVSVMLVAALNTVGASRVGQYKTSDRGRGVLLAQALMTEIVQQSYEETVDTSVFGRESSESSGSRADYDDVDDYHNWSASPPQYQDGTALPNLDGWARRVGVEWVTPGDPSVVSLTETGVKQITVTVTHNTAVVAVLVAIRAGAGPDGKVG